MHPEEKKTPGLDPFLYRTHRHDISLMCDMIPENSAIVFNSNKARDACKFNSAYTYSKSSYGVQFITLWNIYNLSKQYSLFPSYVHHKDTLLIRRNFLK